MLREIMQFQPREHNQKNRSHFCVRWTKVLNLQVMEEEKEIQQEIFTYKAPGLVYSSNWSVRPDKPYRLAFGSFSGSGANYIEVIQLNRERTSFVRVGGIEHTYPATKLAWLPDKSGQHSDLFATTSDFLRLYLVEGGRVRLTSVLTGVCTLPSLSIASFSGTLLVIISFFLASTLHNSSCFLPLLAPYTIIHCACPVPLQVPVAYIFGGPAAAIITSSSTFTRSACCCTVIPFFYLPALSTLCFLTQYITSFSITRPGRSTT